MTKQELNPYCIVEFRDGTRWLRVGNTDALIGVEDHCEIWNTLNEYNDDLIYSDDEDGREFADIVKVFECIDNIFNEYGGELILLFLSEKDSDDFDLSHWSLVWERENKNNEKLEFVNNKISNIQKQISQLQTELDELNNFVH